MTGNVPMKTGTSLYRDFLAATVECSGKAELVEGLSPKGRMAKCRLPHAATEEDALATARAFMSVYVQGNPMCSRLSIGGQAVAESYTAANICMLCSYFPDCEATFEGLLTLAEMEHASRVMSPHEMLFRQLSTGVRAVAADELTERDQLSAMDSKEGERLLGIEIPPSMVCVPSNLRRKTDGAAPAQHERPGGLRGFAPEEDATLTLYERYRSASRSERLAACSELKAALSFAIHPRRQDACEVPYSLLDALEASGCRAVLDGGSTNQTLLHDSQRGLSRCMEALHGNGDQSRL